MDTKEIYALIDKFEKSSLTELSLELDSAKLKLKRGMEQEYIKAMPVSAQMTKQEEKIEVEDHLTYIKSPLVGTFYRASGPDAKSYVNVGQAVKKGAVVGLIEAMKLMNEVIAPMDGIIEEIVAENEGLVQYEEVLIKMKE